MTHNCNFAHFFENGILWRRSRFFEVKTHKVTPYFEDLDKRRRTNFQLATILKWAEIEGSS